MIGTRLGQYRIDALLGQGGMGAVYLATDEMLGRQVAIKVLRDDVDVQGTATERFRSEAQILSRLDHPCILRLYGFSQHEGVLYMVTEYVKGEALQRRLERGVTIDPPQVVAWASQVLDALDYAHQLGVVHRDIKPANIHLGDDQRLRILDLGVALSAGLGSIAGMQNPGTPSFMAPELFEGEPASTSSDIYAAGVTLYHLLTRRYPYGEIEPFQHPRFGDPHVPTRYRPDIPRWLENIVLKAVARDPEARFETAEEMLLALEHGELKPILAPQRTPLIARARLVKWQWIAMFSLILNFLLIYLLVVS
jgi:serine/threonine protein kinase